MADGALSGMVAPAMATSSDDDKDKDVGSAEEKESAGGDEQEKSSEDESYEEEPQEESPAKAGADGSGSAAGGSRALNAALRARGSNTIKAVRAAQTNVPKPPSAAGLGKSLTLFIVVVGGISLLMLLLGTERGGGGTPAPKWEEGQNVDVEITLVSTDKQDLACASGTEVKGLHCGFESQARKWSKSEVDDKKTLRPYSTTNSINFMAAGVWSEPALAGDKLPATRFSLKCKFNVAGKMPRADIRWHEGESWNNVQDWYAGAVSDCKLGNIQN